MDMELIEKWKQNRIPNEYLTDEEYTELSSFGATNLLYCNRIDDNDWRKSSNNPRNGAFPRRLRPDYQPSPESKTETESKCIATIVCDCGKVFEIFTKN